MAKTLLYELTCPACGKAARVVFARLDGQATCGDCGHSYRVQIDNLRHFRVVSANSEDPAAQSAAPESVDREPQPAGEGDQERGWSFPWRLQGFRTGVTLLMVTITAGMTAGAWRLADLPQPAPTQTHAQVADPAPPQQRAEQDSRQTQVAPPCVADCEQE